MRFYSVKSWRFRELVHGDSPPGEQEKRPDVQRVEAIEKAFGGGARPAVKAEQQGQGKYHHPLVGELQKGTLPGRSLKRKEQRLGKKAQREQKVGPGTAPRVISEKVKERPQCCEHRPALHGKWRGKQEGDNAPGGRRKAGAGRPRGKEQKEQQRARSGAPPGIRRRKTHQADEQRPQKQGGEDIVGELPSAGEQGGKQKVPGPHQQGGGVEPEQLVSRVPGVLHPLGHTKEKQRRGKPARPGKPERHLQDIGKEQVDVVQQHEKQGQKL